MISRDYERIMRWGKKGYYVKVNDANSVTESGV